MTGKRAATIRAASEGDSSPCVSSAENVTGAAEDLKPCADTSSRADIKGPVLIVNEKDFRIVRLGYGDGIRYVLEVLDEPDALGCERWRPFNMDSKHLRQMLGFMVKMATKGDAHGG